MGKRASRFPELAVSDKWNKIKFPQERIVEPIRPMTAKQADYLKALRESNQVFVVGCAGTGKTWIGATHAADNLRSKLVRKIILARPNMPCGRTLGYDPGSEQEKVALWAKPTTNVIKERIGANAFENELRNGNIEIVPFEKIRGQTFKDCTVILDEAQNTSVDEIKMFLTRIGENAQVIVNGDVGQSDLKVGSGLAKAIHLIKSKMLPIPIIEFGVDDIVRSGVCEMWVRAFHETPS